MNQTEKNKNLTSYFRRRKSMNYSEKIKGNLYENEILEKLTNEIIRLNKKLDNSDAIGEFDEISGRIKGLNFARSIISSANNSKDI